MLKRILSFLVAVSLFFVTVAGARECIRFYSSWSQKHLETQARLEAIFGKYPTTLKGLPPKLLKTLFEELRNHRVAGLDQVDKYDPQGLIGFCFGRSLAAFLLAKTFGLDVMDVGNLFIVGDLRSGDKPEWRFHVTSVVRLSNGRWYAFDPVVPQNRPIPVEEWVATVRQIWDKGNRAKLYFTTPFQVLPDIRTMAATPALETGKDIIDLSFDPTTKDDILPGRSLGDSLKVPYYEISPHSRRHFLEMAPDRNLSFTFDQLVINGQAISFNGFFSDLMASILDPQIILPETLASLSTSSSIPGAQSMPAQRRSLSRYGMGLGAILGAQP